jgi:hypothetical protein
MNYRRNETYKDTRRRDSRKVAPDLNPKFRRKSDLTLGFVNSSSFVQSLAVQSTRQVNIDRMRSDAVTNQTTNPQARASNVSKDIMIQAMNKITNDATNANNAINPNKLKTDNSPSSKL